MEREVDIRVAALEGRHWWFVVRREDPARIIDSRTGLREGARSPEAGRVIGATPGMLARRPAA